MSPYMNTAVENWDGLFNQYWFLADPDKARGCSTNSLVINSLIESVSQLFPPTALRRRHTQTDRDSSSSFKIDYVIVIKISLNPEGHENPISGLKLKSMPSSSWHKVFFSSSSYFFTTGNVTVALLHFEI